MAHSLFDVASLAPLVEQGCIFLTPNQRLSRRIASEWDALRAAAGERVWEPIPAYPLQEWLRQRWELAQRRGLLAPTLLLNRQQEHLLWRRAIERHTEDSNSPTLLRPGGAAESASEARDLLLRFDVDPRSSRVQQLFGMEPDCAVFLQWLELFEQSLQRVSACTSADVLACLASLEGDLPGPPVALVECTDLEPLVDTALRKVSSALHVAERGTSNARCRVHPFPDGRSELQGVARWAASVNRQSPQATLGIVLAGKDSERVALEYLLRREFGCLGENYNSLPVNFSAGISLAEAPVVRDALALLSLGLEQVSVPRVVALLRSRFARLPDAHGALAMQLVQRLHASGNEHVDIGALRSLACNLQRGKDQGQSLLLAEHLLTMSQMRELKGVALPSLWLQRFNAILDLWGWPGAEPLDSLEYQQVTRWYQTQDQFRALDQVSEPVDFARALALLREACESQVSHPQTADSPVQVLGPLEAVGLAFEHLWICGMQASQWPSPPRPNPFIPLALQSAHNMPHATPEREWAFSRTLLSQYRAACSHVHASYSEQVDGVTDLPSAMLEDFSAQAPAVPEPVFPPWLERQAAGQWQLLVDDRAPAPLVDELERLRGGSAILADQSNCAFRAFARRRLRIEALPDFVNGIAPTERGNIVHRALEHLWRELGASGSLPDDEAALDSLVLAAAQQGIGRLPQHRRIALGSACVELEQQCLQQLLLEWLQVERERASSFEVVATEEKETLSLGALTFDLRVDRIDRLPGEARVIIDYKTGQCRVSDWIGERPREPQLLLYLLAAGQAPAALAFARVRPGDCAFVGLGELEGIPGVSTDVARAVGEKLPAEDWQALTSQWRAILARLAEEFLSGEAAVDPLAGSCQYCEMKPLCRVGEAGLDAVELDA